VPSVKSILLVLDPSGTLAGRWGEQMGTEYQLEIVRDVEDGLRLLEKLDPDIAIVHLAVSTFHLSRAGIRNITEQRPELPVIALLAPDLGHEERLEVMRESIFASPGDGIRPEELALILGRAQAYSRLLHERRYLRSLHLDVDSFELAGGMARLHERVQRAAASDQGALIYGERGSGRTSVAKKVHLLSGRSRGPFVVFNPTGLSVEDCRVRLFGRETIDGLRQRGALELAAGGTLLIQELESLPDAVQPELYRSLAESWMTRVGGLRTLPVDVRVMATAHLDLRDAVQAGRFHKGLFNQLHMDTIEVMPLRERREDVPALLRSYLRRYSGRYGKSDLEIDLEAESFLQRQEWRGNLSELRLSVELAALRAQSDRLGLNEFSVSGVDVDLLPLNYRKAKKMVERDFKRRFFDRVLILAGGKVTLAAQLCEIPRPSLSTMLKEVGIRAADYKRRAKARAATQRQSA
jgi:DNA-binding NtrC family response regulator